MHIIMAAQQAAELAEQNVIVIEGKTVPQGITAMLNFSPDLSVDELREVMTDSLSGVTTMLITYAARDSDFDDYEIHEGDYMALYNGALVGTDKSLPALVMTLAELVRRDDREFINIYYGADIDEAQAQEVADCFTELCGGADVNLINGGQPVYYYMISAE